MTNLFTISLTAEYYNKKLIRYPMKNCCNLYFLSALACQLAECISSDEELAVLSADLVVLGDLLANILARNAACKQIDSTPQIASHDV